MVLELWSWHARREESPLQQQGDEDQGMLPLPVSLKAFGLGEEGWQHPWCALDLSWSSCLQFLAGPEATG